MFIIIIIIYYLHCYFLDDERGMQTGSKIKIKIHENLTNGQYKDIASESPYSVLTIQNINTSRTSKVSIINYYYFNKLYSKE